MQISTADQYSYIHSGHRFPRGVLNILSMETIHALVQMWKLVVGLPAKMADRASTVRSELNSS